MLEKLTVLTLSRLPYEDDVNRLGRVVGADLEPQMVRMNGHGFLRAAHVIGSFLLRLAARQAAERFLFARREMVALTFSL